METVTIPKVEYERLKRLERDAALEGQFTESLEDLRSGRYKDLA